MADTPEELSVAPAVPPRSVIGRWRVVHSKDGFITFNEDGTVVAEGKGKVTSTGTFTHVGQKLVVQLFDGRIYTADLMDANLMLRYGDTGMQLERVEAADADADDSWTFIRSYDEALKALYEGEPREEVAQRMRQIANLPEPEHEGSTRHTVWRNIHAQVSELAPMLEQMAEEPPPPPIDPATTPIDAQVPYHIYHLRDVAVQPMIVPSQASVQQGLKGAGIRSNDAVTALHRIGQPAVPALIALLDDRRPTRSISTDLNGSHALRYQDVALQILEAIAARSFGELAGRGVYLSNVDDEKRAEVLQAVQEWAAAPNRENFKAVISVRTTPGPALDVEQIAARLQAVRAGMTEQQVAAALGLEEHAAIAGSDSDTERRVIYRTSDPARLLLLQYTREQPDQHWTLANAELAPNAAAEDASITGRVFDSQGNAVGRARVALVLREGYPMRIQNGQYENIPHNAIAEQTDAEGRFHFPPQTDPFDLVVLDKVGVALQTHEQLAQNTDVVLQPWGKVEGTVMIGEEPGAQHRVSLYNNKLPGPNGSKIHFNNAAETDAEGRFQMDHVQPGEARVERRIKVDMHHGFMHYPSHTEYVEVQPGQVSNVTIGGSGRPVVGRIRLPEAFRDADVSQFFAYISPPRLSAEELEQLPPEMREAQQQRATRVYAVFIAPDLSYRVEDVPAGTYQLNIGLVPTLLDEGPGGDTVAAVSHEFTIDPMPGGRSDEPYALPDLEVVPLDAVNVGEAPSVRD